MRFSKPPLVAGKILLTFRPYRAANHSAPEVPEAASERANVASKVATKGLACAYC